MMYMKADGRSRAGVYKWIRGYAAAAAAGLLFGTVYEIFSHGVYSVYMLGAWTVPCLCALLLLAAAKKAAILPGNILLQLLCCGAATLTAGSLMKGVLDIYGTTNGLTVFYPLAGGAFILLFAALYITGLSASKRKQVSEVLSQEEETNIIEKKRKRGSI